MKPTAQNRYILTGKKGHHVESLTKENLIHLRKHRPDLFRYQRIRNAIQVWADVIRPEIIYPPKCITREDFKRFNKSLGVYK